MRTESEQGFALLIVIFVVALSTILVLDFADQMEMFQRSSRSYTEQVQGTLMLKSAVNLAKLLVEAPKLPEFKNEDWAQDPWNNIGSLPSIDLEGVIGELRLMIVDEDGKIDINAIQSGATFSPNPGGSQPPQPQQPGGDPGAGQPMDSGTYWRNTLKELFELQGFVREQYPAESFRTLGNVGLEAGDQVAAIVDWLDRDNDSFQDPGFEGSGIEGNVDRAWFYNRSMKHIAELAAVPGMTLERVQRIAPFVKVSPSASGLSTRVNVNTAPYDVLVAMGFQPGDAEVIIQKRLSAPYTNEILPALTAGYLNLNNRLKVKSNEFSAYSRIRMPSRTFWVRAVIGAQEAGQGRKANVRSIEFY